MHDVGCFTASLFQLYACIILFSAIAVIKPVIKNGIWVVSEDPNDSSERASSW